ncbi:MAG: phenylalanine--tRNA ligase subunit beta [Bacilli bacterium]|nr:phenylalanine--tRNA ligase subunit beta [Bacilli bacterium]
MLVSRKFLNDYIDIDEDLSIQQIASDMTNVGNEYDYAGPLIEATNLVVGEILECENIPDTHLHNCKVDVGEDILDIVCGAPNVREGLKVIVALPGAHLPGGEIKKSTIRGFTSNGMLCSLAELGLDNKFLDKRDKEGIHEFPEDTEIGINALDALGLNDEVIDFELTSNRGDLLSIMGMAYELGAIYKKSVKGIDLSYKESKNDIKDSFNLEIKTDNCKLFYAKKVQDVVIDESPSFIKERLIASGIRPINNVVDISNFVMLETGQPLHFYDADSLGDTLIVRQASYSEKLTTLDNIERTLSESDIVIADKEKAIGLAGVMGGLSTEVRDTTKNIIIESAIFDATSIRKTSKKILRSEASNRFEKGLDPKRTKMAIERCCNLLEKYASGKVCKGIIEYNKLEVADKVIELRLEKIRNVLGIDVPLKEVKDILESLGFKVEEKDNLKVTVPTRRLDISIEEDLIEEVGRMYGMDKIVGKLPALDVVVGKYDKKTRDIKHKLADLGLNETLSYTLISETDALKYTKESPEYIMLNDPMSEDRNTLRYSLLPSLVNVYKYNKAHNNTNINIFEIGACFYKENDEYKEEKKLGILLSGEYYLDIPNKDADFYTLKGIVEELLDYLGYVNRYSFVVDSNIASEFHPHQSASIIVQGKCVGVLGKIHPSELKNDVYLCEINLDKLDDIKPSRMTYKDIPKFPSISKDVSFIVDKSLDANSIMAIIKKSGGKLLSNIKIFDIYVGEKIDKDKKAIAFNLEFLDMNKTLTDDEVMVVFNKIIDDVTTKLGCLLRDK